MSEINDTDLVRFLKAQPKSRRLMGLNCLDEFDLAAFVEHQVTEGERQSIQDHLAECRHCREQVRFLIKAQRAEIRESVPATLLSRAVQLEDSSEWHPLRRGWLWRSVGAVAAGSLLVAVVTLQRQKEDGPRPGISNAPSVSARSEPGGAVSDELTAPSSSRNHATNSHAPAVLFPNPGALLPRSEIEFRWESVRETVQYQVRLVTPEGEPVWDHTTDGTSARLTNEAKLTPGGKYFVWVRAYLEDGQIVRSKAVPFIVSDRK